MKWNGFAAGAVLLAGWLVGLLLELNLHAQWQSWQEYKPWRGAAAGMLVGPSYHRCHFGIDGTFDAVWAAFGAHHFSQGCCPRHHF
jgi:hypothetical protein